VLTVTTMSSRWIRARYRLELDVTRSPCGADGKLLLDLQQFARSTSTAGRAKRRMFEMAGDLVDQLAQLMQRFFAFEPVSRCSRRSRIRAGRSSAAVVPSSASPRPARRPARPAARQMPAGQRRPTMPARAGRRIGPRRDQRDISSMLATSRRPDQDCAPSRAL